MGLTKEKQKVNMTFVFSKIFIGVLHKLKPLKYPFAGRQKKSVTIEMPEWAMLQYRTVSMKWDQGHCRKNL